MAAIKATSNNSILVIQVVRRPTMTNSYLKKSERNLAKMHRKSLANCTDA